MTTKPVAGHLLTGLGVYPDERCDSTVVIDLPHGTDYYETRCGLHHEHDPQEQPHTDGTGAFWGEDGEVEYR